MMYNEKISAYLKRIGFEGKPEADLATLRELQKLHLSTIPFENLDIHLGKIIMLDTNRIFKKIINGKRGGFCFELNSIFSELLEAIGFEVTIISARVANENEEFGDEFDHMALIVGIEGQKYLTDVGFGDFALYPLLLKLNIGQLDENRIFKIVKHDAVYLKVVRSTEGNKFKSLYAFSLLPKKILDFKEKCIFHQYSPDSPFTKRKFCSIATEEGRVTITEKDLIITTDNKKKKFPIKNEKEFEHYLKEIFNIDLEFEEE